MIEYLNIFIIHEFLVRVYLVVSDKIETYRTHLAVYTMIVSVTFMIAMIVDSSIFCYKNLTSHGRRLKAS